VVVVNNTHTTGKIHRLTGIFQEVKIAFQGGTPPRRRRFPLPLILSVILKMCERATLVGLMIFRSVCVLLERNVCERLRRDGFDTGSVYFNFRS
jgi:hypothetical protein